MTEEEKKAIEYFKEHINYFQEQIKFIETVDCDYYDEEYELYKNRVKQFNKILNLIKKLQQEKEYWKNGFERELESNRENVMEIIKKDKIIESLEKGLKHEGEVAKETRETATNIRLLDLLKRK